MQLSQEIDQASSKASSSSSLHSTSLWTSSSSSCAQSKSELPVSSYPTFHIQESKLQCHEYFQVITFKCRILIIGIFLCDHPTIHIVLLTLHIKCMQRDLRAPRPRMKIPENDMPQPRKLGKVNTKEKACLDGMKKKRSPCWSRMKLLGC